MALTADELAELAIEARNLQTRAALLTALELVDPYTARALRTAMSDE